MNNRTTKQNEAKGKGLKAGGRSRRQPVGTDRREIEWQYEAEELGLVEAWLEGRVCYPGVMIVESSTKELEDTYYDTEDWRLHRAGYALRIRWEASGKGSEATMKSLVSEGQGNLRNRREISEPLKKGGGVDVLREALGPVGERIGALIGTRELRSIFEVYTCRRTFDLLQDERGDEADGSSREIVQDASGDIRREGAGSRIGEVALDSSEISLGDEVGGSSGNVVQDASGNIRPERAGDESHEVAPSDRVTRLTRVEVEVDPSAADGVELLQEFVEAMEGALDLRPTGISKFQAGLSATGQSPQKDPDLGSEHVDSSLSVGEVAFAVLRRQFAAMKAHEAGTRLGEDPEELHDMRVATRRMRAAIKFFEDALPERASWFRDELKHFAGVLGEVRDLDVQIGQLEGWAETSSEEGLVEAIPKITGTLQERRLETRVHLLESLNSERYECFESSFAETLQRGPSEEGPAAESILKVAPDLLSRPYSKWRKAAKRLDASSDPEEYHELRKKGKRLRYALEFLSGVYGEKYTGGLVKPLKKLQDGLGNHQDLIVAGDLLEELAIGPRRHSRRTAFAMGSLAGRLRREADDLRASVPHSKPYRKLAKGKAWKRFEKGMKKATSKK